MRHAARHNRIHRGFTLAEVLLALGILGVLLAVAVPSVASAQAGLKQLERDSAAREIFAAAQNRLTQLQAAGELDTLSGAALPAQPSDFPGDETWSEEDYRYVTQDDGGALLGPGTIDETVRAGQYVIEYDRAAAAVYGVFYAEKPFDYDADTPRGAQARRAARLGYYGGAVADQTAAGACDPPKFYLHNEDTLTLEVVPAPDTTYTVTVAAVDGSGTGRTFTFKNTDMTNAAPFYYQGGHYYLLLDSLDPGSRFRDLFPGLTPGADLKVTVEVTSTSDPASLPATLSKVDNSLFAQRKGDEVEVAYARHLQNLSSAFSNVDYGIVSARQTADITWDPARSFLPIGSSDPFKPLPLKTFDGGGTTITGLKVGSDGKNLGLFASFSDGSIQNVRLVDPLVKNQGVCSTAGALAGYLTNVEVSNCQVYASGPDSESGVTGSGCVGALVGSAQKCSFTRCSAALPRVTADSGNAGGLVGMVVDSSLTGCCADSGLYDPGADAWAGGVLTKSGSAGGLAGLADGMKATDCYSAGWVQGRYAAGFAPTGRRAGQVSRCYSAAVFQGSAENATTYGFSDRGSFQDCYYLSEAAPTTADVLGGVTALSFDDLRTCLLPDPTGVWARAGVDATFPYGQEGAYPFPILSGLTCHRGDWPALAGQEEPGGYGTGVVYYERYTDGSLGIVSLVDGQRVSTLKGNDFNIESAGYGYLAGAGEDPNDYSYTVSAPLPRPVFGSPLPVGDGMQYYPFTEAALAGLTSMLSSGTRSLAVQQHQITQYDPDWGPIIDTFYFDPLMAGAVVTQETADILGTPDYPLEVRTQAQFAALGRNWGYAPYCKQTHDITMVDWVSISPEMWDGSVIDGGGNHIYGLTAPLFDTMASRSTLRDLYIDGAELTVMEGTGHEKDPISGILVNRSTGKTEGCTVVSSSIRGGKDVKVAGLVGTVDNGGAVTGCSVDCTVSGEEAAGLAYTVLGPVTDCRFQGSVTGDDEAAGLVMKVEYGGSVTGCSTDCAVSGEEASGLVHETHGPVTDCSAQGSVTGTDEAAGLVLKVKNSGPVIRCSASCTVSGKEAAGLVYKVEEYCSVTDSRALGVVKGTEEAAGLVLKLEEGSSIKTSYANCAVSGERAAGFVLKDQGIISDCYALGTVSGHKAAGFLLDGEGWTAPTRCYTAVSPNTGLKSFYGFGPSWNDMEYRDCCYLARPDLPDPESGHELGTPLSYSALSALQLGQAWTAPTAGRSHPDAPELQGQAYPFPMLAAQDHYGDWPAPS